MIRLLLALAGLVGAPLAAFLADPSSPPAEAHASYVSYPSETHTLVIDAKAMPGAAGWFLVPVTTSRDTYVSIEAKYKQVAPSAGPAAAMLLVAFDDGQAYPMPGGVMPPFRSVEANARGHTVACCEEVTSAALAEYGGFRTSGAGGGTGGSVGPTRPVFVGLAAVGWAEGSKAKITLTSDAPLRAGAPHVGTRVEAVDLVQLAQRAGDNVLLGGQALAGGAGEASVAWTARGTGIVALQYGASGEASARITLDLPSGTALAGLTVEEAFGGVTALKRGAFSVRLTDLQLPPWSDNLRPSRYGYLSATAMFADVDVPMDGYLAWHHLHEDADW